MKTFLSDAIVTSGSGLLHGVLFLLIVGIVLGIVYYLIQNAPFLNALFKQILGYIIIFVGALILINWLLGLTGNPIVVIH